jgi:hypothetical protein
METQLGRARNKADKAFVAAVELVKLSSSQVKIGASSAREQ